MSAKNLSINTQARILIVAPHPDDESIGCGGVMLKYGRQCELLLLTDGRRGHAPGVPIDEEQLVQQRAEELRCAAAIAGIKQVHMLGIPDGTLRQNEDRVSTFDITPYDCLFVPNHLERHPDHAPVLKIIQKMCRKQHASAQIYEYEVWSPIPCPTDALDLTNLMDRKLEMVRQYQSQTRLMNYEAMTEALNRYRGVGQKTTYAETYALVPQLSTGRRIFRKLPQPVQAIIRNVIGKSASS